LQRSCKIVKWKESKNRALSLASPICAIQQSLHAFMCRVGLRSMGVMAQMSVRLNDSKQVSDIRTFYTADKSNTTMRVLWRCVTKTF